MSFDTLNPQLIHLGEGCLITGGCKIISHFYHPEERTFYNGEVRIGKKVFMGMNSMVVAPVTIGDEAVIGAGSVVTKDVPAGEIWGGVPAKFIRKKKIPVSSCEDVQM